MTNWYWYNEFSYIYYPHMTQDFSSFSNQTISTISNFRIIIIIIFCIWSIWIRWCDALIVPKDIRKENTFCHSFVFMSSQEQREDVLNKIFIFMFMK